ncbi:MAG: hypothetical protein NTV00_07910 [Methylococcales bacterium]|nr:hypothetical protein [Methylococcales bacterium]
MLFNYLALLSCGLNLHRRELTVSQKAVIALEILPMLEDEALERQRKAGVETHSNQYKSEKVQLMASVPEAVKQDPEPTSRDSAATILGIGSRIIQQAKQIAKEAPEKLEEIKQC